LSRAGGLIAAGGAGATAAAAARLAYAAANQRPPGGTKTWSRTNHRGEPVTLLEGPALAAGAIAGVLVQAGLGPAGSGAARSGAAMAVAGAGAAAFGAYDDLAGSGDRRGFGGHLGALRHGEVTTGTVKLGGIGVTGIVSAALAGGSPGDVVLNAALVAGGANLLNLFDLRPGRAIKVAVASGALLSAAGSRNGGRAGVAAPLAAALALLPEDLGERAMLGDCGANALGAVLGAAAAGLPRPARIALLAGIAGLTAASEKVSFTKVIERTPPLRWLDMLGRRPPEGTGERAAPPRGGLGRWSPSRNTAAGGFPRGVRGARGKREGEESPRAENMSPRERAIGPPGPARSTGAATTLRSAEKTDPTPPDE
jgi:UDP-GlcNAc:undecaprenyl-phosphate/decaprenyl-phosphate GlcNAc-1-phosphate transferase